VVVRAVKYGTKRYSALISFCVFDGLLNLSICVPVTSAILMLIRDTYFLSALHESRKYFI
jgi:hypothetical protein